MTMILLELVEKKQHKNGLNVNLRHWLTLMHVGHLEDKARLRLTLTHVGHLEDKARLIFSAS